MGFFANIFGYLLNFLYEIIQNYGLAIILFSIILKLILIPISIKQQRTMKKSAKIQKESKTIQDKYKSDPQKMNQEIMSLYKRENMSPFSGCLSAIVQIVILLSMFYLVRSPLTHMKKVDPEIISQYQEQLKRENEGINLSYPEIAIVRDVYAIKNGEPLPSEVETKDQEETGNEVENLENNVSEEDINTIENVNNVENIETENNEDIENIEDNEEEKEEVNVKTLENIDKLYINMEFLGLDLSSIPNQQLDDYRVYIIPVLYVLSTFISMRVTNKITQGNKEKEKNKIIDVTENKEEKPNEMDAVASMNKNMMYMLPIMSISISLFAPLGLALYWLVNNILMTVEKVILNKILDKEEDENA